MTGALIPALLLLFPTLYHIEGVTTPPKINHKTVNQEIEIYSSHNSYTMRIRSRAPVTTPTLKRAVGILHSLARQPEDTCVTLARRFCRRLKESSIACRSVSGVLYITRMPATYAHLYRPLLHGIPHRWVELFDPGQGWVAMDPTQPSGRVTARHIPISAIDARPSLKIGEVTQWD